MGEALGRVAGNMVGLTYWQARISLLEVFFTQCLHRTYVAEGSDSRVGHSAMLVLSS